MFTFTRYAKMISISLGLFYSTSVLSQETVKWFVQEWKPFNITRGADKHTGSNDELIKYIHKFMPQYKIKWVKMDLNRFVESLKKKQDVCKVDLFKTPDREAYTIFSDEASVIDLNQRIFFFEKKAKRLGLKSPVSLALLLENKSLKTYFPLARKYGSELDPIINAAEQKKTKIRKDVGAKKLIKNFYKRKIDYLVEYSPVVKYYADYARPGDNLISYSIKETNPYIKAHVGCADTEFGRKVMNDINKVLAEHRHKPEYLSIFEKWHSERDQEALRQFYKNFK